MHSRHVEMSDHRPNDALKGPNLAAAINKSDKDGLRLISIGAREGMLTPALLLAQNGADLNASKVDLDHRDNYIQNHNVPLAVENAKKSPVKLAEERGHTLLASVLVACGAPEEKQPCTENIRNAVMYWTIENYQPHNQIKLWENLQPVVNHSAANSLLVNDSKNENQITEYGFSRFIEFATFKNNRALTQSLMMAVKYKAHSTIHSGGFWASMNRDTYLQHYFDNLQDDALQVLTVEQLAQAGKHTFAEESFLKLTTPQRSAYSEKDTTIVVDSNTLTSKQTKIYQSAAIGRSSPIQGDLKDLFDCLLYAFKEQNYVAFSQLKKMSDPLKILEYAVQEKHKDFVQFWVIVNHIDIYQQCLDFRGNIDLLFPFIDACTSRAGVLQSIISRHIKGLKSTLTASEYQLFITINQGDNALIDAFLYCANDRYPHEDFGLLLNERVPDIDQRIEAAEKKHQTKISLICRGLLKDYFKRFEIETKMSTAKKGDAKHTIAFQDLPVLVHHKIFNEYLPRKTAVIHKRLSKNIHNNILNLNSALRKKRERQLTLFKDFKTQLQREIDNKHSWSERKRCEFDSCGFPVEDEKTDYAYYGSITCGISLVVFGVLGSLMSPFLNRNNIQRIALCNEFETTLVPSHNNQSCLDLQFSSGDFCFGDPSCDKNYNGPNDSGGRDVVDILAECADLCARLVGLENPGVGYGFATVPPLVIAFFAICCLCAWLPKIRGTERFQNLFLNTFSTEVTNRSDALVREFSDDRGYYLDLKNDSTTIEAAIKKITKLETSIELDLKLATSAKGLMTNNIHAETEKSKVKEVTIDMKHNDGSLTQPLLPNVKQG